MNHNITGTFEGYSINENKNIMIVVTSEIIKNNQGKFSLHHNFRYYKNLECEYSYIKEKMEDFDLKENIFVRIFSAYLIAKYCIHCLVV